MHFLSALLFLVSLNAAAAPRFYAYAGAVDDSSVLLAWGTTAGGANTIGRDSRPAGKLKVTLGPHTDEPTRNWTVFRNLEPDQEYDYRVSVDGKEAARGKVRTWPKTARKLTFFVVGDFGFGGSVQYRIAEAMTREFERRAGSDSPVRFVLSTGDTIYGNWRPWGFSDSGDDDQDWDAKFFAPYRKILASVPFYCVLGNHDGNATEARGDLTVFLDNLFFPGGEPSRYFRFVYGGLADFVALDSTSSSEQGPSAPMLAPGSKQVKWLQENLAQMRTPWKIAIFHHPPYTAGPNHAASLDVLSHVTKMLERSGVQVVFNGHEHNFQFSEPKATGGIHYVISGGGGEARKGNVLTAMKQAGIAGWAAQPHFLAVTIDGDEMQIQPISYEPFTARGPDGQPLPMPLKIRR